MSLNNIYIVFGVSGCGKTTIGRQLAQELHLPFYDADDFHPEENITKMSTGLPLNDSDRNPWLLILADSIKKWHTTTGAVLACSALKEKYRNTLESIPSAYVKWIFLDGSQELITERMMSRKEHFFKPHMLTSQFDALEKPKSGVLVSIDKKVDDIVKEIKFKLKN